MVSNNSLKAVDFVVTAPAQYVGTVSDTTTVAKTGVTTVTLDNANISGLTTDSTKALFCPTADKLAKKDVVVAYKCGDIWNYEVATPVTATLTKIDATGTPVVYTIGDKTYTWSVADGATAAPATTVGAAEAVYYVDKAGEVVLTTATVNTNYAYVIDTAVTVTNGLAGSATVTGKVMAVLSNGTIGTYDLKLTKAVAAGVTTYSVAGTNVYSSDSAAKLNTSALSTDKAQTALNAKCFCYTLSDTTLALAALPAGISQGATAGVVTTGTTTTNGMYLNSETAFVVYDAAKGTATLVTGNTNLNYKLAAGAAVVRDANGIAKCVFSGAGTSTTTTVKSYIYVDVTKAVMTSDASHTYYAYNGIAADGSTVVVTATDATLTTTGIYTYETDKSISSTNYISDGSVAVDVDHPVVAGAATVNGSLMSIATVGTYNITGDTKTVYIDTTKTTVTGSNVLVVLAVANGAVSTNAAVIYVVG
jgi:hypothetical protein